jgi:hypothetical protein
MKNKDLNDQMKYQRPLENKYEIVKKILLMYFAVSMLLRIILHKGSEIRYLNTIELNLFWSKLLDIYKLLSPIETVLLLLAILWFAGMKKMLLKNYTQRILLIDLLSGIFGVCVIVDIVLSSYAIIQKSLWMNWEILVATPFINICFIVLFFDLLPVIINRRQSKK